MRLGTKDGTERKRGTAERRLVFEDVVNSVRFTLAITTMTTKNHTAAMAMTIKTIATADNETTINNIT